MKGLLQELRNALEKQLEWLEYSNRQARSLPNETSDWKEAHYDVMESLCARFGRGIDFLVRKIFRALDDAEFQPQGTLLDTVHRAHQRKLFDQMDDIRQIKDLRNQIAHEYSEDVLTELFPEVIRVTPVLLQMMRNSLDYLDEHLAKIET
ncbi:MAG: hypothetical protein HQM14_21125 [SAR324 cluster bacterium]|nr:hypothetical protein [SAR324 cluster bacterium]